jgi:uncharacterized protein
LILLDTSGLLAAIDTRQRQHAACAAVLREHDGPLLLSPFVLAELDYMLATRVGQHAETALLGEVARGAYQLESFGAEDVAEARRVIVKYASLELGLADASIVVLAARHRARDVLTLDRRHFGVVKRANGRPFRVLP